VAGSREADEHGGLARRRVGPVEEDRSNFEKTRSKNPTSSGLKVRSADQSGGEGDW